MKKLLKMKKFLIILSIIIVLIIAVIITIAVVFNNLKKKQQEELAKAEKKYEDAVDKYNDTSDQYEDALQQIKELEEINEELLTPEKIEVSVTTLQQYVAPASELITYKYYYTDSGSYKKEKKLSDYDMTIPFTTDELIYTASGTISAGIDVDKIEFDVDNDNQKIVITMPEPRIIAHELDEDSFQTYDVKNSIFTSSELEDYSFLQKSLKETEEEKLAENNEFWKSVKDNAEHVIRSLITANEHMNEFELEFEWEDK